MKNDFIAHAKNKTFESEKKCFEYDYKICFVYLKLQTLVSFEQQDNLKKKKPINKEKRSFLCYQINFSIL